MRAVYRGAVAGALALLALIAAAVLPVRGDRAEPPPAETPELVEIIAAETPPTKIIIRTPESFAGDLDDIWVAIPVDGMPEEG